MIRIIYSTNGLTLKKKRFTQSKIQICNNVQFILRHTLLFILTKTTFKKCLRLRFFHPFVRPLTFLNSFDWLEIAILFRLIVAYPLLKMMHARRTFCSQDHTKNLIYVTSKTF